MTEGSSIPSPSRRPISTHPLEAMPVGRLGLHLVKSLMEETRYRRAGGRNVTAITRRIAPPLA